MKAFIFCAILLCFTSTIWGMEYRKNGEYSIPVLGLGTYTVTNETELTTALHEALEIGYRHIDTAARYGNEHIIGKVLKEWLSSGKVKREDLFITTKLATVDMFPDQVENALKTSLEKLQLDYVDLYLVHMPVAVKKLENSNMFLTQPTDIISVWKKMEEQVDAGRTRTIGLSNFNISQIGRIKKIARIQPANLQVETHLSLQQREIRDFANKNNITVVAYSPLGAPGVNNYLKRENRTLVKLPNILQDETVSKIADKYKKSNAQVALRFLLQSDLVAIPKSTNPKRLKENIDVFNFNLSEDDMKSLKSLDRGSKGRIFTMLNNAIDIADHPEYPFHDSLDED